MCVSNLKFFNICKYNSFEYKKNCQLLVGMFAGRLQQIFVDTISFCVDESLDFSGRYPILWRSTAALQEGCLSSGNTSTGII